MNHDTCNMFQLSTQDSRVKKLRLYFFVFSFIGILWSLLSLQSVMLLCASWRGGGSGCIGLFMARPLYCIPHTKCHIFIVMRSCPPIGMPIWSQSWEMRIKGSFLKSWSSTMIKERPSSQILYVWVESQWWSHSFGGSHLVIKCLTSKEWHLEFFLK